ncbi:hypothetical protein FBUS_07009 [Fasciolopsis buskii]|uniref:ARF7 effector protein C-terminal domain-containing protein n=1 Tax=Fasciolopsis buskii TaxID=27845 RepID=A0A8E0VNW9_9TREM|nr:hypothetical protein FBUS_07009 [Fasciolopsis buski]
MNSNASVAPTNGHSDRNSYWMTRPIQKARKSTCPSSQGSTSSSRDLNEIKEPIRVKIVTSSITAPDEDAKSCESESSSIRSSRKNGSSKHTKKNRCAQSISPPIYDSRGRRLGTLLDTCDCLRDSCPGCHLPCRRCHSMMCGPVCRVHRSYRFKEARAVLLYW